MNGFQDNVNLRTSLGLVSDNLLLFQDLSNNLDSMFPYLKAPGPNIILSSQMHPSSKA